MNAFQIKLIAITCMLSSHVGIFLFPQYSSLRFIGSAAFPLFAWLIANGAHHTNDIKLYLRRLFIFALVAQVPFTLANQLIGSPLLYLNVFFTLFLGLLAIYIIRESTSNLFKVEVVFVCAILAQLLNTDYGAAGVLSIVTFYLFFNNVLYAAIAQTIILWVLPVSMPFIAQYFGAATLYFYLYSPVKLLGIIAAACIIALYNNTEGIKLRYLFYVFYPLHYFVIFIIKIVLLRV